MGLIDRYIERAAKVLGVGTSRTREWFTAGRQLKEAAAIVTDAEIERMEARTRLVLANELGAEAVGKIPDTAAKMSLLRRLVKQRIAQDPNARLLGQTPAFADSLSLFELISLPEATIVTCVETLAYARAAGRAEGDAVQRIVQHRGIQYSGSSIKELIRAVCKAECSNALYLPDSHVEWCIGEACDAYGVGGGSNE